MSILIKGMDMPMKCCDCIFARDSGLGKDMVACIAVQGMVGVPKKSGKSEACPLVEVPMPHGRLIDGDELEKFELPATLFPEGRESNIDVWTHAVPIGNVKNAPTVIEAEVTP